MPTWEEFITKIKERILDNGITICIGILIFVIGIFVIKLLMVIIRKSFRRNKKMENITKSFFASIIKGVLYILLLLIVSQILGIPISGFVALLSICGLAISLAIQDTLANLLNGLILVSTKPFKTGEYVKAGEIEGTVMAINTMTTTLKTPDNKEIIIPNTVIIKEEIINYDRLGTRRLDIVFEIPYEADIEKAKEILLNCVKSDGRMFLDPAPVCYVTSYNASSISLSIRAWCESQNYWNAKFSLNELMLNELKKANIFIPFNQLEVRLRNDDGKQVIYDRALPERVEVPRTKKDDDDLIKNLEKKMIESEKKRDIRRKKKREKKLAKFDSKK